MPACTGASMTRSLLSFLLVATLAHPVVSAQQSASPPRSPEDLARALEARYRGISDFSVHFTQQYRGGFLRTQSEEEGTLLVKRPGRMRWTYEKPERKEVVATGELLYVYLPAERQVHELVQDHTTTPALFLSGEGDLLRDFEVALTESPVPDAVALKLTPRTPEPEYEHLVVAVDPATLQIRALVTLDSQGGESTLRFSNLRENRGIADREFEFRPPRGVDIIRDGQVIRN
jgi:outer membrane lipoprotein carrier protein